MLCVNQGREPISAEARWYQRTFRQQIYQKVAPGQVPCGLANSRLISCLFTHLMGFELEN